MQPCNSLTINSLELELFLGWPNDERLRKQTILVDLTIRYASALKACETDHLDDTTCYRELIEKLRTTLSNHKYHLIEYVAAEIHRLLIAQLPTGSLLKVSLTKRPLITGLGSVTFHYGELS